MRASLCRPDELGEQELGRWREIQRADPRLGHPFLAPEFALALGRHRNDVRVAVLEDSRGTVGFFAHQRDRWGVGRALGHGVSNLQGLVVEPDLEWDGTELLERCGLSVFEFDEFVPAQAARFRPRRSATEPAPFIDLSHGFDAWLAAKRTETRAVKASQRKLRKLAREVGHVHLEFASTAPETLHLLLAWKSHQYRRTGRVDRFARPWFRAAFTDLAETWTADFAGVRSVLYVDDRPLAIRQALLAGGILSDWFPCYDTEFAHYSPGQCALLEWVRAAAGHGVRRLDLGKGYGLEKEIFGDAHDDVADGWADRPSSVAVLRRVQQAPRRRVLQVVLTRPALRRAAREALSGIGRVRMSATRG